MEGAQRVIKGFAIAFAVMIIVSIVSVCVGAGMILSRVFLPDGQDVSGWQETVMDEGLRYTELEIKLETTSLRIERGEKFEVLADEEIIELHQEGERMKIVEKDFGMFNNWNKAGGEVKVILPEGVALRRAVLDMGAGVMYAHGLVVEDLDLDMGVGRVEFDEIKVTHVVKVDGGAGLLVMKNAELRDLSLDMGVGKVEFNGDLMGNNEIDAGMGKLELRLARSEKEYKFILNKGLGGLSLNGRGLGSEELIGDGEDVVKISGGVGAIEITTKE